MADRRVIKRVVASLILGTAVLEVPTLVGHLLFDREKPFPTFGFVFPLVLMFAVAGTVSGARRWGDRRSYGTTRIVMLVWLLSGLVVAGIGVTYHFITLVTPGLALFGKGMGVTRIAVDGLTSGPFAACVWALVFEMPRAIDETRRRERERQDLLREAERARVRATLEPHFVLNTLNAIGGLVADDPETARQLLGDLGDLLRDAVRLSERTRHSTADEIAWIERYARVLEARHRGRLTVECRLDPDARELELPVLLLQPLVENAIQHGALRRPGGGRVRVEALREGRGLRCVVEDEGPGMPATIRAGARGLALTRRRLETEMPGSTMTIDSGAGGTRVVVIVEAAR